MKILIVYAHPEASSFNHALKEQAVNVLKNASHEIKLSDLYAIHFNPVAGWDDFKEIDSTLPHQYGVVQRDAYLKNLLSDDIKREQEKLSWCDAVIFQFPLWWFGLPAILKGWFDRLFATAYAYDKDKMFSAGLLQPIQAMLSVTTQSPSSTYQADGRHGDMNQYLHPIHHTLRFAGIKILQPFVAYGVMNITDVERKQYLVSYEKHLSEQF
jgi:putative NADPH-quinone reductase